MEKYYIKKENITKKISDLMDNKIPVSYKDVAKELIQKVCRTIRDDQYLIIEIGETVKAYNVDPAKVPVDIRQSEGENLNEIFYF